MANRFWQWLTEPLEQRSAVQPLQSRLQGMELRQGILDPSTFYPDIDTQLYARQRAQAGIGQYITVREAYGIPSVNRAITLLSSLVGTFDLKEYTNGQEVPTSTVVRRPQRAWTPRDFKRDTVMYMAEYGEAIWLVLERDFQKLPSDLLPVPPQMMKSDWDGRLHSWYSIDQNGKKRTYKREDVVHITLMRDSDTGRGIGPMQACGLALNAAREADVWASRFFVGSIPSLYLDSDQEMTPEEIGRAKEQWLKDPPNIPKFGHGYTPTPLNLNPETAQLTDSRRLNRGEVALMFGINGKLLEYAESGSSIVYSNVGGLATELVRLTLAPNYLEPIEQAFSDLRPRGTEVRFDLAEFQRADDKTRYDVHEKAIALGVYDAEEAARREGITGSATNVEPVPLRRIS